MPSYQPALSQTLRKALATSAALGCLVAVVVGAVRKERSVLTGLGNCVIDSQHRIGEQELGDLLALERLYAGRTPGDVSRRLE